MGLGMKKARISIVVFLAGVSLFIFCGTASASYTTSQLTNNANERVHDHQLNNNGQVVWEDDNGYAIDLYSGGVTTQLPNSAGGFPQINDSGQVVWEGTDGDPNYSMGGSDIFLYSGGSITKLTNNGYCRLCGYHSPQINNSGQVVWDRTGGTGIFFYSGGVTTQLSGSSSWGHSPQINNSGQVVWVSDGINLYSGGVTTQLPNSSGGFDPQINDSGQVIWATWDGSDVAIDLYSGGVTTQLPNSSGGFAPQINNSGQVVWQDGGSQGGSIYLYSGGVTTYISSPWSPWNHSPQINGDGQVVWRAFSSSSTMTFLYSGGVTTELTNPINGNNYPQYFVGGDEAHINDAGEVVWDGWDGYGWQVFLYHRQCNGSRPNLQLSRGNAFWASYADYSAGKLSVNMMISNSGTGNAYETRISGSSNTNGVPDTGVYPVGDIAGGASSSITLKYNVPAGLVSFSTTVFATAQDSCGTTYSYPGPYPG